MSSSYSSKFSRQRSESEISQDSAIELQQKLVRHLKVDDLTKLTLIQKREESGERCSEKQQDTVRFSDLYELEKVLGAGGFGIVC